MSRRERETIAMLKEDNWCPGPLMAYGLVIDRQLRMRDPLKVHLMRVFNMENTLAL